MRRLLLGFFFSTALFMAGTASALVMTSGEVPVIDHDFRNVQHLQYFGELIVTDIQLHPQRQVPRAGGNARYGRRSFLWHSESPFEWPKPEWLNKRDDWKGMFPFENFRDFHDGYRNGHSSSDNNPVPEPTTAQMFGAGLLGIGLIRRRQR